MKKIVRLTESDLIKIVKRVIQEQDVTDFESQIQSLDSNKDAMDLAKQMFGEKSKDNLVSFIYKFYKKHNLNIPSAIRRRLSDSLIISLITKAINETPANEFYDPYDYADTILEKVINDNYSDFVYSFTTDEMHDEFYDFIKNEYSDIILDYWADVVGFDMW